VGNTLNELKDKNIQTKPTPRKKRSAGFITRRKLIWVFVSVIASAGVLVLLTSMKKAGTSNYAENVGTFTVRQDDLTITVTESGSVKAQESTDVMCEVEGRGVEISSIIAEGTMVTPEDVANGKILCQLNASDLQDRRNKELIDFSSAKASYIQAQEAYQIQIKQNESDIAAAKLAVEFGLMDLQNHLGETTAKKLIDGVTLDPNANIDMAALQDNNLGGSASQQLKTLEDAILLARGNLERAIDVNEGTQKLYDANYASELDLTGARLDVQRYQIQMESSVEELKLYKLYNFPKQTKQFLSDYYEAQRELDRTFAQTRSQLAQALARLESTEASFKLQKEQLTKLERMIAACTIRAPSAGIVIYGSSADWWQRREDPIEVGDGVHKGQKIFTIPNSDVMGVELRVHESSVNMVKPGQKATITVEAYPDIPLEGKVLRIAPLPDPPHGWFDPSVKVYTTQIAIDGAHDILKPGMSAKVEVLIEQLKNVLIVPIQVVANREGKKVCYVATPQGPKQRQVQTGSFNDTYVHIISGLEAGEQVMLIPPKLIESE
jgi:HlyD family secretion protein